MDGSWQGVRGQAGAQVSAGVHVGPGYWACVGISSGAKGVCEDGQMHGQVGGWEGL